MKKRIFLSRKAYEDDWEDEDLGDDGGDITVFSPSYAPVATGIFDHRGLNILRHPIVSRVGFHREGNKHYCPTMDDNSHGQGAVVGYIYAPEDE